ncbi:hypothetical protein ACS0TY_016005 [Phlomoides rotata]
MENNFGFDYYQYQHKLSRGPNLPVVYPFHNGYTNIDPVRRSPRVDEDFTLRNLPSFPVSGLQELKAIVSDKPAQKRFLVFDQSGDKTTMLFSSGVQTPAQFGTYRVPIPPMSRNLKEEGDTNGRLSPNLNGANVEDYSRDVSEDEMHENTEELDALLCSDDDSDFSEDDETSTGHSPSTMTDDNGVPESVEEGGEEVDSFCVPTKRRKFSSLKTGSDSALESHAESSCKDELDSWSGRKRSRKERIHETVSILQTIVPNVNEKDDPIVVIDEAIQFLKSLKVKAKALGLDFEEDER